MKDLNLIPQSYILEKKKTAMKFYTTLAVLGVCIAVAAAIAVPLGIRLTLQWKMGKLEQQVNETSSYMQTEKQFNYIEDLYNQRLKEGDKLKKLGIDIKKVIGTIEEDSPEKLYIKNFNVSDSQDGIVDITLNGAAASEDEVASFVKYLRNSKCFNKVLITSVGKVSASDGLSGTSGASGQDCTFGISLQYPLDQ